MLVFFNYAYAELEINTIITDDFIIISGLFDEDSVGIALKQNGMLIDTARGDVEFGHYYIEMQNPGPGTYELLVGSATNKKSVEIIVDPMNEIIEEEHEDTPYVGNVAPLIEPKVAEEIEVSTIIEEEIVSVIPSWVKQLFIMWTSGQITDEELITGIEYLVSIGVIQL